MRRPLIALILPTILLGLSGLASAEFDTERLALAGDNRAELERALADAPADQREGIEFLIANMPESDLQTLSADYLLENTRLAYQAGTDAPWAKEIPKDVFLNNVLPYASINERRDEWRADFRKRCLPMIEGASSPSEAAALINQKLFQSVGVKYSTRRVKADQSPLESMKTGLASCTGLSVLLIDACRSVGIPARFVGTPLWFNQSGNHSWVEVWDDGWHFTGAAEPTGNELDRGWFVANATKADRSSKAHAIYATSFKQTPLSFPCVWNRKLRSIPAVNVTDRYVALQKSLPPGMTESLFVVHGADGNRASCRLRVLDGDEVVFEGQTNDEGFDANDHLRVELKQKHKYSVLIGEGDQVIRDTIITDADEELHEHHLVSVDAISESSADKPATAIKALRDYLQSQPAADLKTIRAQSFSDIALTADDVVQARKILAEHHKQTLLKTRSEEMKARVLVHGDHEMPFDYRVFGDAPEDGRSLYISMHGGGGAPKAINDRQWENQKRLYQPEEGVYVAPRAPTDTWNLWHQKHIDPMFVRLIENMVAFENVNPNRVYVMGYSAGGDGVYQLAPRLSDRWAAAAMMAGHPNETSALGLRNVPFALQMGGKDAAYKRNQIAADWQTKLAELHEADLEGYEHFVKIYPNKGHWMDREDAVALPWMAKHTRNVTPSKIVWVQDDVTHSHFYWLGVEESSVKAGATIIATVEGQTIDLTSSDVNKMEVFLDDRFIDLDKPIQITSGGQTLFEGQVTRSLKTLAATFDERSDSELAFPSSVEVEMPKPFPQSLVPAKDLPIYTAAKIDTELTIDGRLDEEAWQQARKTTSFVDLVSGQPTRYDTRSSILWDDEFLYIGFWLEEPNVDAEYKDRDDPIYYDNDVEVFIAGKDAYYEFEINSYGTVYEGFFVWQEAYEKGGYASDPQLAKDAPNQQEFDGVGFTNHPRGKRIAFLGYDFPNFKSAVHINGTLNDDSDVDQGWTVELAFPWKEMKWLAKGDDRSLPPKVGDQWRIDLFRFNKTKAPEPATDSSGWAFGKHGVWDSHIPEIFPVITFAEE
ncbi:transglutaminase domain-containing protein [Rhodopirellula baltica]|uniref:Transglutaminase domain protein n=1 Tax=Rhodopirellula baltica SWK14 TaxID=993516 RepID=L7CKE2_RHOBT|nr:transglutaminase domain-containing protein [Rhodopirellula baltica]ELP34097.1 transglutaminase domain protein [Rhodopirellula baltica SWK14]